MQRPFRIGDAIYLRAIEREDAPPIAAWFNDPEVTRYTTRYRPLSLAEEVKYIESMDGKPEHVMFAIVERASDTFVGVCGLHGIDSRNRRAELGLAIGEKSHWSRGIGAEATQLLVRYAFESLNLHRVYLTVFVANERAHKLYQRLGFKDEGVLRDDAFVDGKYHDIARMGMLEHEWRALNP